MANPLLSEKSMSTAVQRQEGEAGWAAPNGSTQTAGNWNPPINDGPVSTWHGGLMTVSGTANATIMLLLLLIASATVTWISVGAPKVTATGAVQFPVGWVIGGAIVGLIAVMVASFKPARSPIAAPIYALAEGIVVGAVSRAYSEAYQGIVLQAVGTTLAVFAVMLFLYRAKIVRVTDRSRRIAMGAMFGLMGFYFISAIFSMFGAKPMFFTQGSATGILFSVLVAGLAAYNLALNFDTIEYGVRNKMPAYMEWYGALGVTVTLVWLYLEILRLLSQLRDRN